MKNMKITSLCVVMIALFVLSVFAQDGGKAKELIEKLRDKEWSVRASAANELGSAGAKEAIPELMKLLKDNDAVVRRSAAVALKRLGVSEEEIKASEEKTEQAPDNVKIFLAVAIGLGLAIAVFGGAFGQSRAIAAAVEAMARQPEMAGTVRTTMFLGIAFAEALALIGFVLKFI